MVRQGIQLLCTWHNTSVFVCIWLYLSVFVCICHCLSVFLYLYFMYLSSLLHQTGKAGESVGRAGEELPGFPPPPLVGSCHLPPHPGTSSPPPSPASASSSSGSIRDPWYLWFLSLAFRSSTPKHKSWIQISCRCCFSQQLAKFEKVWSCQKKSCSRDRACPEWRCWWWYNNGGNSRTVLAGFSPSVLSLQSQSIPREPKADRQLDAGRSDRESWKMHPFTKVGAILKKFWRVSAGLPPFHRLIPPWSRCSRPC